MLYVRRTGATWTNFVDKFVTFFLDILLTTFSWLQLYQLANEYEKTVGGGVVKLHAGLISDSCHISASHSNLYFYWPVAKNIAIGKLSIKKQMSKSYTIYSKW